MDISYHDYSDTMQRPREKMTADLMRAGIYSGALLNVIAKVPRHLFVSEALRYNAYENRSLPIGHGQTISRPIVIATMVQALQLKGEERLLEIGTGSGYQTAILAEMAESVVTIERIKDLSVRARNILVRLNYPTVSFIHSGDFNEAQGQFDAIIVCAGAEIMPTDLLQKLTETGTLIIPVSNGKDHVIKRFIKKNNGSIIEEDIGLATFVPLIVGQSA